MKLSGLDPETISISDWCDIAWAVALEDTPVMASPHEYRETMYYILFLGEQTEEMRKHAAENAVKNAQESLGKPPPQSAIDELEAQRRRAMELAAALND